MKYLYKFYKSSSLFLFKYFYFDINLEYLIWCFKKKLLCHGSMTSTLAKEVAGKQSVSAAKEEKLR